jgi:hypothetical protein
MEPLLFGGGRDREEEESDEWEGDEAEEANWYCFWKEIARWYEKDIRTFFGIALFRQVFG